MSGRGGFSIVEVMVGTLLFAMIAGSMAAFQAAMLRHGSRADARMVTERSTRRIEQAVRSRAAEATFIARPPPGSAATSLQLWSNVDHLTGVAAL